MLIILQNNAGIIICVSISNNCMCSSFDVFVYAQRYLVYTKYYSNYLQIDHCQALLFADFG
jgi:hypothetical protein